MTVDVVLPVHNEADSIGATLRDFHAKVAPTHDIRFVVCEDGSRDGSAEVLKELSKELPILLLSSRKRKGYSRAVIDGMRAAESELVAFVDSDGQYHPDDFERLVAAVSNADMAVGIRSPRADHWGRLLFSGSFRLVYKLLLAVPQQDPSCSYLIVKRPLLEKILAGRVGVLKQGFWWEFAARAASEGGRIAEIPVSHQTRRGGASRVYRPSSIIPIAVAHVIGLFALRRELAQPRRQ